MRRRKKKKGLLKKIRKVTPKVLKGIAVGARGVAIGMKKTGEVFDKTVDYMVPPETQKRMKEKKEKYNFITGKWEKQS